MSSVMEIMTANLENVQVFSGAGGNALAKLYSRDAMH